MIITIASQKGGSGKTTICINLALAMAGLRKNQRVALVDTDEQRSCIETLNTQGTRENLTLYEVTEKTHRLVETIRDKHEIIIIDTPPHSQEVVYQAAAVSDLVIIPLQPSPLDVRGVLKTVQAMEFIKENNNPHLLCRFLINRVNPRSILSHEIRATLTKFYPYPIFNSVLQNREIYKRSLVSGKSVLEYDKNGTAGQEIKKLINEINRLVKK
jgi:chromosome partitioning protein